MGKLFYGTHSDKVGAKWLANRGAQSYMRGVCWTPSNDSTCHFNKKTRLWTCMAAAHHHEGSCGTWEIHHRGAGTPFQLGYTCDENGCRPYLGGDPHSKSTLDNKSVTEKLTENNEEYTDALPEDYQ